MSVYPTPIWHVQIQPKFTDIPFFVTQIRGTKLCMIYLQKAETILYKYVSDKLRDGGQIGEVRSHNLELQITCFHLFSPRPVLFKRLLVTFTICFVARA